MLMSWLVSCLAAYVLQACLVLSCLVLSHILPVSCLSYVSCLKHLNDVSVSSCLSLILTVLANVSCLDSCVWTNVSASEKMSRLRLWLELRARLAGGAREGTSDPVCPVGRTSRHR